MPQMHAKLTQNQMLSLMKIIKRWRRENPEVKSFPLVRFSNFAADRRESALTREEEPEGLFESVESASETVARFDGQENLIFYHRQKARFALNRAFWFLDIKIQITVQFPAVPTQTHRL